MLCSFDTSPKELAECPTDFNLMTSTFKTDSKLKAHIIYCNVGHDRLIIGNLKSRKKVSKISQDEKYRFHSQFDVLRRHIKILC